VIFRLKLAFKPLLGGQFEKHQIPTTAPIAPPSREKIGVLSFFAGR
jgi:hypothetical protein